MPQFNCYCRGCLHPSTHQCTPEACGSCCVSGSSWSQKHRYKRAGLKMSRWEHRTKSSYYYRNNSGKTGTVKGLEEAVKKIAWMDKVPPGYLQ